MVGRMLYQSISIALVLWHWDLFCNFVKLSSCIQNNFISSQYYLKKLELQYEQPKHGKSFVTSFHKITELIISLKSLES